MGGKVRNENYVVIQGFMINELKLKGNELIIYSIIYGFSQAEGQVFSGSLQYLADWTNSTKRGVQKNLQSLIDKKYIIKRDKYINGVKFCEYYVSKFVGIEQSSIGIEQSSIGGIEQSSTNNIDIYNKENNIDNKKERKKSNYDSIIDEFVSDKDIKEALYEFIKMRTLIKKPMTDRALKQLITKLYNLSPKKEEQIKILDNSIINNWSNIYPLKDERQQSNKTFYKREEIVPDWFKNEPTKAKEPTKEEQEELEQLLNDISEDDFETRKKALQERLKNKYGPDTSK